MYAFDDNYDMICSASVCICCFI